MDRCKTGREGEKNAEKYIKKLGYKILARNYISPYGEIDIIAKHREDIVFIEVKSYRESGIDPESKVDMVKKRRIEKSASHYLSRHGLYETSCRFEVFAVNLCSKKIEHYKCEFFDL